MPTILQERAAAALLDGGFKTKRAALKASGYSDSTARAMTARTLSAVGAIEAQESLKRKLLDKARGIKAISAVCLDVTDEQIKALDIPTRVALGLQAAKVANDLGDEPVNVADGVIAALTARNRRFDRTWRLACRAAARAIAAGELELPEPPIGRRNRRPSTVALKQLPPQPHDEGPVTIDADVVPDPA